MVTGFQFCQEAQTPPQDQHSPPPVTPVTLSTARRTISPTFSKQPTWTRPAGKLAWACREALTRKARGIQAKHQGSMKSQRMPTKWPLPCIPEKSWLCVGNISYVSGIFAIELFKVKSSKIRIVFLR